jgi:hypothetical protein
MRNEKKNINKEDDINKNKRSLSQERIDKALVVSL